MNETSMISLRRIERRIFLIRGQKVMLDMHLAEIYGVLTKNLNKAVARNKDRFPADFRFQLTGKEWNALRFQIGTSKEWTRGGRRYLPYAFTEHGAVMLASILNSPIAVRASIHVVRAFVRLREFLVTNKALAGKLRLLEQRISRHDAEIHAIFDAIRQLMQPPEKPKRRIGFRVEEPKTPYGARKRKV